MTTNSRTGAVERATGRPWEQWLAFMDAIGAGDLGHQQIAVQVEQELAGAVEHPAWWAQSVTVAYEQHIGRRLPGQRADGTFATSVSRATTLGMGELLEAWTRFAAQDEAVRSIVVGHPRTSGTDRRATWRAKAADGSSVVVTSEPRGATASLVATHSGLATPEANDEARQRWASVVERFVGTLQPGG